MANDHVDQKKFPTQPQPKAPMPSVSAVTTEALANVDVVYDDEVIDLHHQDQTNVLRGYQPQPKVPKSLSACSIPK